MQAWWFAKLILYMFKFFYNKIMCCFYFKNLAKSHEKKDKTWKH